MSDFNLLKALLKIERMCNTPQVSCGPEEIAKIAHEALVAHALNQSPLDKEHEDVREFHQKFDLLNFDTPGHLTRRKLDERFECMQEELTEFTEASDRQDLAAIADALIDLVYFAKGTSVMLGLPWRELWDDVQRANLAKTRGVGPRGHKVDCVKPPGWIGPQTETILRRAGYQPDLARAERQRDDEVYRTAQEVDHETTD
jgi:predicted HAD superfamily Cof-like phosphohydrolase